MSDQKNDRPGPNRIIATIVIALLAAAVVAFLVTRGSDDQNSGSTATLGSDARVVAEDGINDLATEVDHPVFWAGPREGTELEVATKPDGSSYVRYLTGGAKAGDTRPDFFTVATYPVPDAYARLEEVAGKPNSRSRKLDKDTLLVYTGSEPTSVYLAKKGVDLQIEVYDPTPGASLKAARAGEIISTDGAKGG